MDSNCAAIRGELTEQVLLGRPLTPDVSWHLSGCPDCAREAGEIAEVATVLARSESSFRRGTTRIPNPGSLSADPGDRIEQQVRVHRSMRPRRVALFAAAAALIAGLTLVPVFSGGSTAPTSGVALEKVGFMVPQPWGTEVPVALSGLQTGQTYQLITEDADGHRMSAGSVRAANDQPVRTRMITAMRRDAITVLLVEDEHGTQIAQIPASSPFTTDPPSSPR
jgi:hypothetical protein